MLEKNTSISPAKDTRARTEANKRDMSISPSKAVGQSDARQNDDFSHSRKMLGPTSSQCVIVMSSVCTISVCATHWHVRSLAAANLESSVPLRLLKNKITKPNSTAFLLPEPLFSPVCKCKEFVKLLPLREKWEERL
jgi:hypothetical protein